MEMHLHECYQAMPSEASCNDNWLHSDVGFGNSVLSKCKIHWVTSKVYMNHYVFDGRLLGFSYLPYLILYSNRLALIS